MDTNCQSVCCSFVYGLEKTFLCWTLWDKSEHSVRNTNLLLDSRIMFLIISHKSFGHRSDLLSFFQKNQREDYFCSIQKKNNLWLVSHCILFYNGRHKQKKYILAAFWKHVIFFTMVKPFLILHKVAKKSMKLPEECFLTLL